MDAILVHCDTATKRSIAVSLLVYGGPIAPFAQRRLIDCHSLSQWFIGSIGTGSEMPEHVEGFIPTSQLAFVRLPAHQLEYGAGAKTRASLSLFISARSSPPEFAYSEID